MKPKFTPGPWRVTANGYIASQGYVPIRTPFRSDAFQEGPGRSDHSEDTLEANARLIAAAPEMYEALAAIEAVLRGNKLANVGNSTVHYALCQARTAIAKATGEQP